MIEIHTNGDLVGLETPVYIDDEYFQRFHKFLEILLDNKIFIKFIK